MDVMVSGLSLLHEPDEIIEIRSIEPKPVISGYFRADSPAIAKELSRYPNRTFYQTMNRVKSACYAREQHERLVERPHETTTDSDIAGYQWLLIDADPVRPSGVSASREEKEAARRVAGMTMKKLMAMGFCEPVVADSGNGYHLLFHIHASPKEKQVLADFLAVLDMWFSTEQVKIDTAVFNPARITKLYGTIATKGASTPERPHRRSGIIRKPEKIETTPMDLIRNIASERQKAVAPQENPRQRGTASSFNLDQFLSDHHIEVTKKIPISTGMKYQLAECPFDSSHKHGDAAVFAYSNGSYGFHCFHNSCAGYHWHEFREKVDPAAYANSPFTVHQAVNTSVPSRTQPGGAEASAQAVKTGQPRMLDFAEIPNYDRSKIVVIRSRFQALDHRLSFCFRKLTDYRNQLVMQRELYAPKTPEEEWHPLFLDAIAQLELTEYELDVLQEGTDADKKQIADDFISAKREQEGHLMEPIINTPIYHESGSHARKFGELEQFKASHWANIDCKKDIEKAISSHFDGFRLDRKCIDEVMEKYGPERVSLVLAATVQVKSWDGRFSSANKDWAFTFDFPEAKDDLGFDRRDNYAVTSHPAILDGFINLARQKIRELEQSAGKEVSTPVAEAVASAKPQKKKTHSMER